MEEVENRKTPTQDELKTPDEIRTPSVVEKRLTASLLSCMMMMMIMRMRKLNELEKDPSSLSFAIITSFPIITFLIRMTLQRRKA